mmetsp:Transcript_43872/g.106550  ORF Transcript_43872/g.106550 Transcript_43872/m.106550 type:complete len:100 (-) Transcript_43872:341-640(-)
MQTRRVREVPEEISTKDRALTSCAVLFTIIVCVGLCALNSRSTWAVSITLKVKSVWAQAVVSASDTHILPLSALRAEDVAYEAGNYVSRRLDGKMRLTT